MIFKETHRYSFKLLLQVVLRSVRNSNRLRHDDRGNLLRDLLKKICFLQRQTEGKLLIRSLIRIRMI